MGILNNLSLVLLLAHVLGDYPLQSEALANRKMKSSVGLWQHMAIHGGLLLGVVFWGLVQGLVLILPVLLILLGHLLLDLLKIRGRIGYLIDQALHIVLILGVSELVFPLDGAQFSYGVLSRDVVKGVLLIVLILKPANVSFKVMFAKYQYVDPEIHSVEGAGAVIGNMERILSAVFLVWGQVAAIGLIYTAKSIARFKQIENNRQFAEYYLIGTLFSILYVVLAYFLLSVL